MEMTFQEEHADVVIQEGFQLFKDHWKEIALYQDKIELSPDYTRYRHLYDKDELHVVTARDEYGRIVGYLVSLLQKGLHYKNTLWAYNDILYVCPEYRKGTTGIKLLKFAEKALKEIGVDVIVVRVKTQHNFGKVLERMGYENTELSFTKHVGE